MISGLISYHGGHSGQYCNHAEDQLEEIIKQYISLGFKTVGITEHIPPSEHRFLYPDEIELNLTVQDLYNRFASYIHEMGELKQIYKDRITIYTGMETETVTAYQTHVPALIKEFKPDYIVGSVHHVDDICFDYSQEKYDRLTHQVGGLIPLYCKYFDLQFEMLQVLKPFVVGHFDLIRIYDDNYKETLKNPEIEKRIDRNLDLIKSLNLVMDYNLRPLVKGKNEPYITESILNKAFDIGIQVVPGDDSHSIAQVGLNVDRAITTLEQKGFNTRWPVPKLMT